MIVGMVTIAGSVSKDWRLCSAAEADLVVINPDHHEAKVALNNRAAFPQAIFAALMSAAEQAPEDCLKLSWPIRTEGVIEMLKRVEAKPKAAVPATTLAVQGDMLRLASILRTIGHERDADLVWRIKGAPDKTLYIAPAARKFFYEPALARLRTMRLDAELTFETVMKESIPEGLSPRPLVGLQWVAGDMIGSLRLLPWLKPDMSLRLKSWPNFPVLHHDARHRRIAALLARKVNGLAELTQLARTDAATVRGFVNACNLCGYLSPQAAPAPAKKAVGARQPSSPSLFKRLRSALGIVEH
jgi:hypothetical protein